VRKNRREGEREQEVKRERGTGARREGEMEQMEG
jgi:hypothetical protein